jgi:hypothetical protein
MGSSRLLATWAVNLRCGVMQRTTGAAAVGAAAAEVLVAAGLFS